MPGRLFTRKSKPTLPAEQGLCFDSCDTLPLYNFIKITTTKDLKWLIKEGNPTNLDEVWANIFSEYSEMSADQSTSHMLQLAIKISYLENRLTHIQSIVDYLATKRNEELITLLKNMGFKFAFVDLEKDLKRTVTVAKSDIVKLQKAQADYEKNISKDGDITEGHYNKTLAGLSKHYGYLPNKFKISVTDYVSLVNEYNTWQETAKK